MGLLGRLSRVSVRLCILIASCFLASPSTAAPPLSLYGNLPGFETAAISPSGQAVALIAVVGDQRRLLVVDKVNKLILSAPLGNRKGRDLTWGGDDSVLLGRSATVGLG